jgi:hypothetical protein
MVGVEPWALKVARDIEPYIDQVVFIIAKLPKQGMDLLAF